MRLIPGIHTATHESINNDTEMKHNKKKKKVSFAMLFAFVPAIAMSIFHLSQLQTSLSAGIEFEVYAQEVAAAAMLGPAHDDW
jgi:hypothetical protein